MVQLLRDRGLHFSSSLESIVCTLNFEHFNVANTSDVRIKCCRGRRRRGGEAGGGSLPVSAQSVSGL